MAYQSFEALDVWKRACRLVVELSAVVADSRTYFLREQMLRAALSIPSNIAEGSERDSKRDYIRFLRIAKGSSAELRTQCYIAKKVGMLPHDTADDIINECKEISCMLQGLIKCLSSRKPPLET
ncbi:four helix bundle protein [Fontisphaera persica]|uniref:four helix bundle protein n=1 Tax=Fontisphaera persica TaxID=2974023 RepID=UPI0024BFABFC|nr:four helix bundle protein [Fontisphaera persica]WCJ59200.1 four helix bundle protein [Fontisphaera persica]